MTIKENCKRLSFEVAGYEYPGYKSTESGFDHDANWLMVSVVYSDDKGTYTYKDACLLTVELESLIAGLSEVISGKESLFISDFLEPYLKIVAVRAGEQIVVGLEFIYDTSDGIWKSHKLSEMMSHEDALLLIDKLKNMNERYPKR